MNIIPVESPGIRVSSKFGVRIHPVTGVRTMHNGIDLVGNPNNRNEPILCVADGVVTAARQQGTQWGPMCWVAVQHENGLRTAYMHQKTNTITQRIGDVVKAGECLGIIGTTGQSTGVHLHFQIDRGSNASAIDPWNFLFSNDAIFPQKVVETFPISPDHIKALVSGGVISSPTYWENRKDIQWLPELFSKIADRGFIKNARGIQNVDQAFEILTKVGIMNTPDYWRTQIDAGRSEWLPQLIINMAKYVAG